MRARPLYLLLLFVFVTSGVAHEKHAKSEVVAYLIGLKGSAIVTRGSTKLQASEVCTELLANDRVVLGKGSSASVSYKKSLVKLVYPANYTVVRRQSVNKIAGGTKETVRGGIGHSGEDPKNLIGLIPPELLKVTPVSVIRKPDIVTIVSQGPKVWNLTPSITLNKNGVGTVTISLIKLAGRKAQLMGSYVTDQMAFEWGDTGWPNLQPDSFYQLRFEYISKVNGLMRHTFNLSVLDMQQKSALTKQLIQLRKKYPTHTAQFLEACLFYRYDCIGEAYVLFTKLSEAEPHNALLRRMQSRCQRKLVQNSE